jgi:hypothetical protein
MDTPPGGTAKLFFRFLLAVFLFVPFVGGAPTPEDLRTAHLWRLVDVGGSSSLFFCSRCFRYISLRDDALCFVARTK